MVSKSSSKRQIDDTGKIAFLFPGQGSQAVGMGLELYQQSPAARQVFEAVDEGLGARFSHLLFYGPEEELRQTINAQPAIMTVSLACLRAMEEALGEDATPQPSFVAGHSLGEYTSLVAVGVLEAPDAVGLVRERGRLMQEASMRVPSGMAAIMNLDELVIEEICQQTGTELSNINAADQIVIAGEKLALARAMDLALARGARRVVPLQVSGAFHTRLMAPAREGMATALGQVHFSDPRVPIVANCDAKPITSAEALKEELLRQLCTSVKWRQSVTFMVDEGVSRFLEIGPGRVLTGLVKRVSQEVETANISDLSTIQALAS